MSDAELYAFAHGVWQSTNQKNLEENILPTKLRADLILRKDVNHKIQQVMLRKI